MIETCDSCGVPRRMRVAGWLIRTGGTDRCSRVTCRLLQLPDDLYTLTMAPSREPTGHCRTFYREQTEAVTHCTPRNSRGRREATNTPSYPFSAIYSSMNLIESTHTSYTCPTKRKRSEESTHKKELGVVYVFFFSQSEYGKWIILTYTQTHTRKKKETRATMNTIQNITAFP